MALTVLVYLPSLQGGFIFDDAFYFTDNTDVHVTSLHLGEWVRAALCQTGTNQFRALSMLSFAANYYFTGLDPYWLKLTNVGIHLLNGLLLFLILRELLGLWTARMSNKPDQVVPAPRELQFVAVAITGAWMLLPINLTAVAYVSQRLESLANVFVFLGLFLYLRTRRQQFASGHGGAMLGGSIAICTLLGLSAKESAVLLPLYTLCIELALTGFRNGNGKISRSACWTHIVILGLPLTAGLIWISTWNFATVAHARTFTIGERLLTEPRVLVDYIAWTLLPSLTSLTFYHDDLAFSRGLLEPPTTLMAILALAALLCIAWWQRKRRPLFCLGILWFFAGHMLTGTIIPLELVFEHRNYFPSMGLLLALVSLLAIEPLIRLPSIKIVAACGFISFFAFTTFLRAEEWSNPLRLAFSEATKRPDSMRAQYDLARILIVAGGSDKKSPLFDEAEKILERNAFRADSGITPLQALIFLNGHAHRSIDPAWWSALIQKLRDNPPSQSDIGALAFLVHCQLRGDCPPQKQELFDALTAALTKSDGDLRLMSAYADFAYLELGDAQLAERLLRGVVAVQPTVPIYRSNLIDLLLVTGQADAAQAELDSLKSLNQYGSLDTMIGNLQARLDELKSGPAPAPSEARPLPVGDAKP